MKLAKAILNTGNNKSVFTFACSNKLVQPA